MRATAGYVMFMTAFVAGGATATPAQLKIDQLLEVCSEATISLAVKAGDKLGWARMTDSRLAEWRRSFLAYNGGTVEVVGWQRGEAEGGGSLSYWVASGPNAHRACSYAAADPQSELLDALSGHLGRPDTLEKHHPAIVASWKKPGSEVSFSQVASSVVISILSKGGPHR